MVTLKSYKIYSKDVKYFMSIKLRIDILKLKKIKKLKGFFKKYRITN